MKSFKNYITESTLKDLINNHDDPYTFLAAVIAQMQIGKLKFRIRGAASTREIIAAWNRVKSKKIAIKEDVESLDDILQNKDE